MQWHLASDLAPPQGRPPAGRKNLGGTSSPADFTDADLTHSSLVGPDLTEVLLNGTNPTDAKLDRSILAGAWMCDTVMLRTRLNYAKMARSWLDKAILSDASLAHADLTGAWLGEAVLDSTNVNETVMHDTWLANARMISTRTLSETQLLKAKVFNSTELLDGYLIDDLGGHTRLVAHINACESGSRRALAPRPID